MNEGWLRDKKPSRRKNVTDELFELNGHKLRYRWNMVEYLIKVENLFNISGGEWTEI
jgi:hypothetical protein